MKKMTYLALLATIGSMTIGGCAGKTTTCTAPEDNPQHHYLMGMKALEDGKTSVAGEKFERALYCDEEFSIAHAGLAIVNATGIPGPGGWMQSAFPGGILRPEINAKALPFTLIILLIIASVSWIFPVTMATKVSPLKAINSD